MTLSVGEVLGPGEQGPADPVEGVVLVTTPVQGGLLNTTSDLIERVAGQLHDVEGVKDRGRLR